MMSSWTLLLIGVLQSAQLRTDAHRQAVDTAATIASLLAADSALADDARRHGAEAVLSAFEPGAAMLFTGQPILRADSGRAAFLARYGPPSEYRWRALRAIASADGRLGCTIGLSTFRNARDSSVVGRIGAYETCWRRGDDGRWRIVGQQRNDSPPDEASPENERRAQWPHSATVSLAGSELVGALDTDAEFARVAAEPAGPGPAFARFAAEDAMLLGFPEFNFGRRAIESVFAGFPADRYIAWEPDRRYGAASGGLAFTVGHSDHIPRGDAPGPKRHGKFLTIWRQRADGHWEFVYDLGSARTVGLSAGS
jgi:ketosteroid isomerase-like protein